jgi:hypothetical protein
MHREDLWPACLVFHDRLQWRGRNFMWAAPVLKSFVESISTHDRHPIDDEFFILWRVRPEGRVVGHLGELPIPEAVIGEDGQHYVFEGVAARRPSGRFDVRALRPGEWIVQPGLVYRQID